MSCARRSSRGSCVPIPDKLRCHGPPELAVARAHFVRDIDRGRGQDIGRDICPRNQIGRRLQPIGLAGRAAQLHDNRAGLRHRHQNQRGRVDRVVQLINPVLRGWVNYFAIGHSSECFSFIRDWVEKKIRRHMGRSRNRRGFGWKRWSRRWLYEELKLFNGYRVRRASVPKALPA